MNAVLISIQPKWCKKIASGRKTLELRKTVPKLPLPFKCYIYCTKDNADHVPSRIWWKADETGFQHILNGKVIGEFVCDAILGHCEMANADLAENGSCVRREDILQYSNGKEVYGWHISDLAIYDEPKPLSEFIKPCENDLYCESCAMHSEFSGKCGNKALVISSPPQSWCYVEVCDD